MDRDGISKTKINIYLERANNSYNLKTDMEKELNLSIGKNYVDQLIKEE